MFIDLEDPKVRTPLGVPCSLCASVFNLTTRRLLFLRSCEREHRTPKGVPDSFVDLDL